MRCTASDQDLHLFAYQAAVKVEKWTCPDFRTNRVKIKVVSTLR